MDQITSGDLTAALSDYIDGDDSARKDARHAATVLTPEEVQRGLLEALRRPRTTRGES